MSGDYPRQVWFMTYGASGPDISSEMLKAECLWPEECYTVRSRELKYTLVRLSRQSRVRHATMVKRMHSIGSKHGIIENQVFGYEPLLGNANGSDGIESHPGFMLMTEHMNNASEHFAWWMNIGNIQTNKSGLLWRYRNDIAPENMPQSMLIEKAKDNYKNIGLAQKLTKEREDLQVSNQLLQDEVEKLKKRVSRQHEIICEYREFVEENGFPAGKIQRTD